ncbi:MAG TPA: thiamine pyrophosphate-binding protein [Longimicrobiales bacterium]|nr:thiamine pyrophosphate-binding protein [Longimicrobiales bacterium]
MSVPGGRIVVRALEDEGVPFTFGIPGTHNIELYDALAESETVRPILVTDEQSASFAADAVWRTTGRLGCVNVVPGAGLTHAMSGIAEAWMDTIPMLVLGCGIRTDTPHGYQLHDVDQAAMVAPVTKAQLRPVAGGDLYATVRRACRLAREGVPGPVFVEVPANLYLFTHDVDLDALRAEHGGRPARAFAAEHAAIERAAEVLNGAGRPLLYLGLGALPAHDHLVALAERLDAPVATTFQGKGVFPETHPLFVWPGFGEAAPPFARKVAADCAAVLAIGCRFGEVGTGSYGLELPGPLVHVDIDPAVIGRNYPAEVAVAGDSALVVPALLERLHPRPADPRLRDRIAAGHAEVESAWRGDRSAGGVSPHALIRAIHDRLGPRTVFTSDSGNGTFLAMEILRLDAPRSFLAPVDYSCMGYSVPAAVGAKLAAPDRPVAALAGDGAFLMTGLELMTAASYGIPIAVFVLRDRELAQIAQFQETALNRKTASDVHDYDLAGLASGLGVDCLALNTDDAIPSTLDRVLDVLAAARPVVVDVAIDYSSRTFFTRGVVRTNLRRLPWKDRLRFVGRAVGRRLFSRGGG